MELNFKIIGMCLMLLGAIHIIFPKYFNWKIELASLNLVNRQMMQTHTFFIALTVFLMGFLCTTNSYELINSELGKDITLGLAIFWSVRMFFQWFVYSRLLWIGKTFETTVHVVFSFFWMYLSVVFWITYLNA